MKPTKLVLSCEHGSSAIPKNYQHLFAQHQYILSTQRAMDGGVFALFNHLTQAFSCDHVYMPYSRLLIDCNRSLHHPQCFSEFTEKLSKQDKQAIIDTHYKPYRQQFIEAIGNHIHNGWQVLHISIHSFTPEFNGNIRNTAIGLLYESRRHGEKEVARVWKTLLLNIPPNYRIRMNYPYKGNNDSFVAAIRKLYSEHDYLGFELEINQALLKTPSTEAQLHTVLYQSIQALMEIL